MSLLIFRRFSMPVPPPPPGAPPPPPPATLPRPGASPPGEVRAQSIGNIRAALAARHLSNVTKGNADITDVEVTPNTVLSIDSPLSIVIGCGVGPGDSSQRVGSVEHATEDSTRRFAEHRQRKGEIAATESGSPEKNGSTLGERDYEETGTAQ